MTKMFMKGLSKNKKGFTLVELMVVVVIIGILTVIAVPVYKTSQEKAKENAHNANIRILKGAAAQYITDNGIPENGETWTESNSDKWKNYLVTWPKNPGPASLGQNKDKPYEVSISSDGTITVTPDATNANGNGNNQGNNQ